MARKNRTANVTLPWERRGNTVRQLFRGSRLRGLVVLAISIGCAGWIYRVADTRSRERSTRVAIHEVQRAIGLFQAQVGRCPRSTTELVHPPRSRTRYLRALPKDGWGRPLWVRCPAHDDPDGSDVISAGQSGSFFVDDNIQ